MLDVTEKGNFLIVENNQFTKSALPVIEHLLDILDYETVIDYAIHVETKKLMGVEGDFYPTNKDPDFILSLKYVIDVACENISEEEIYFSFKLLLLKE